jgi:hypothetical protein
MRSSNLSVETRSERREPELERIDAATTRDLRGERLPSD